MWNTQLSVDTLSQILSGRQNEKRQSEFNLAVTLLSIVIMHILCNVLRVVLGILVVALVGKDLISLCFAMVLMPKNTKQRMSNYIIFMVYLHYPGINNEQRTASPPSSWFPVSQLPRTTWIWLWALPAIFIKLSLFTSVYAQKFEFYIPPDFYSQHFASETLAVLLLELDGWWSQFFIPQMCNVVMLEAKWDGRW